MEQGAICQPASPGKQHQWWHKDIGDIPIQELKNSKSNIQIYALIYNSLISIWLCTLDVWELKNQWLVHLKEAVTNFAMVLYFGSMWIKNTQLLFISRNEAFFDVRILLLPTSHYLSLVSSSFLILHDANLKRLYTYINSSNLPKFALERRKKGNGAKIISYGTVSSSPTGNF